MDFCCSWVVVDIRIVTGYIIAVLIPKHGIVLKKKLFLLISVNVRFIIFQPSSLVRYILV